jgi:hypothetical protein
MARQMVERMRKAVRPAAELDMDGILIVYLHSSNADSVQPFLMSREKD